MDNRNNFMSWVQLHERAWGSRTYVGRPSLQEILTAKIVTFWRALDGKEPTFKVRLYTELDLLEADLAKRLMRSELGGKYDETLARVYIDQQLHRIESVRLIFRKAPDSAS